MSVAVDEARKTVALIDVSGIFYQHWHATENEVASEAQKRTLRDVRRCAAGADIVALALDVKGATFRHELAASYKANREKRSAVFYEQLRQTEEALSCEFHTFGCAGYEADDVIATLVLFVSDAIPDHHVVVHSADKDLCALVGDSVTVISTKTGVVYDVDTASKKFGTAPRMVESWLAITGDSGDNVPGVRGAGPKKAAALINAFGDVHAIIKACAEQATAVKETVGPAVAGNLRAAIDDGSLLLSHKLTTLRRDVPIDCGRILTKKEQEYRNTMGEETFGSALDSAPDAEPTQPSSRPQTIVPPPVAKDSAQPSVREVIDAEPVSAQPVAERASAAVTPSPASFQSTAIVRSVGWNNALEPHDMKSATWLAKTVVDSGMFDSYGTPAAAFLTIMAGREMGLGAMASLRSFHVVEGKPTMSAQLMMAMCIASPLCKSFRVKRSETTSKVAVVEVQRHDWAEPERYTWTIEDAQEAGLTGKNVWKKYPRDMLINRAIAEAARFVFPELMANVYTPEELEAA